MKIFLFVVLLLLVGFLVGCSIKEEIKENQNKSIAVDTQTDTLIPAPANAVVADQDIPSDQNISADQIGVEKNVDIQQEVGVNLHDLGADVPTTT